MEAEVISQRLRQSGIEVIGAVPWGTHFCQFYTTGQDLVETLVPYFHAGLAANEFCMWVTSEPLQVEQAQAAMRVELPDLDDYVIKGQIEFLDYSQWYTPTGKFDANAVLHGWIDKLEAARKQGFEGLRLSGNTFWLEQSGWKDFAHYEEKVNEVIGGQRMLALCSYSLERCSVREIIEVVANHQFALIKNQGSWEIIESTRQKVVEQITSLALFPAENPNPILRVDQAGRLLYANDVSRELFAEDEILSAQMVRPTLRVLASEALSNAQRTSADIAIQDRVYTFDALPIAERGYVNLYGRDITETKRKEEEARRLNRMLIALSQTNQAMMHARSEEEFLDFVCKIVVESCGYDMVWIGYADNDENRSVRPVAYAGFETGYLETLKITWADTERGRGPTGTAIRTGKLTRCRNMLTDPQFAPWRAEALKRGYASSIVLPLFAEGRVFGAINIYSHEPDPFTDEEVQLLSELAGDLAFGISSIKISLAHDLAEEALRLSEDRYRSLFNTMTEGFALHEIICDDNGSPCDYRFLEINPAFERQTGLKREQVIGKTVSEIMPTIEPYWIELYGQVALTGEPTHFENYASALNRYYEVLAFNPAPRQFAVLFLDITQRKQMEAELELSEKRFRLALKNAPVSVAAQDKELRFTWAYNQRSVRPAELIGKTDRDLFPLDIAERLIGLKRQVLETGVEVIEQMWVVSSGRRMYLEVYLEPIRDETGQITGVGIATVDLTERKLAEEALIVARAEAVNDKNRLEAVMEALPIGVAILDAAGGSVRNNSGFAQIWGEPRPPVRRVEDYAAYKAWWADSGKFVQPVEWASSQAVQKGETVIGQKMQIERFDGSRLYVLNSAAPIFDAEGAIAGCAVAIQNISQSVEAEKTMLESERLFRERLQNAYDDLEQLVQARTQELAKANDQLREEIVGHQHVAAQLLLQTRALEAAANGIIITDHRGCIRWANPAFFAMTGYTSEEVIDKNPRFLSSATHEPAYYQTLWQTILAGKVWHGETINRRKDGSLYTEDQTITPVLDEKGEISHFIAIKQDITERKYAEAQTHYSYEREKRARHTAETLRLYSLTLSQSLDLDVVLNTLLVYIGQLAAYDSANIMLLEGENKAVIRALIGYKRWTNPEQVRLVVVDPRANPYIQTAFTKQKSVLVNDTEQAPGWVPPLGGEKIRSWAGIPLVVEGKAIGLLSLNKIKAEFFTHEHIETAEALVRQAEIAIQNAWLFNHMVAGRERLQSLSNRLVEVQENERRYISRELHDVAGQALSSLKVSLHLLERDAHRPDEVIAGIAELKKVVESVLEELHRLAIALRPASLEHLGLEAALRQYIENTGEKHSLTTQFEVIGLAGHRLPPNTETVLYRIVQEALTNVIRHSKATRVDVLLERREDQIILIVEDNGIGFDPGDSVGSDRLGLFGIRERAEMLNGTLTIESDPKNGTTLFVEVPYASEDSHRG